MTTYDQVRQEAERAEQKTNQFYAGDVAKRAALKAAGGLASDMTLRDHFAGKVITGISATEGDMQWITQHGAKYAYQMADAMLEARKTPKGGKT